ncbi:Tripartite motif-containing protein 29 [Acipenser ruthenus]|uniref:Tripartite motif-containing protein 29 n=1 Tax=Acipenser ruthenus TaxID=7906 RepID=A0A444U9J0_ACIRT|nr:Tripartite motif-containing protein 29 [Acipenser ruthenus]
MERSRSLYTLNPSTTLAQRDRGAGLGFKEQLRRESQWKMFKRRWSDLSFNRTFAEIIDKFRKSCPEGSYADPGNVPCDSCTERKRKAVKSCRECWASYCETHIKPHHADAAFKGHNLVDPRRSPQDNLLRQYERLLALLRTSTKHLDHSSQETQKQLMEVQTEITIQIQVRMNKLTELKQDVELLRSSAQKELEEGEKIIDELSHSIEKIRTELIEQIEVKEKSALDKADRHMKLLEQDISELQDRKACLQELSMTGDYSPFLENPQSHCSSLKSSDVSSMTVDTDFACLAVSKAVSELKNHLQDFCNGTLVQRTKSDAGLSKKTLPGPESLHVMLFKLNPDHVTYRSMQQLLFYI